MTIRIYERSQVQGSYDRGVFVGECTGTHEYAVEIAVQAERRGTKLRVFVNGWLVW